VTLDRGKLQLIWHPSSGKQECKGVSHQAGQQEHLLGSYLQALWDSADRDSSMTEAGDAEPLLSDAARPERAVASSDRTEARLNSLDTVA